MRESEENSQAFVAIIFAIIAFALALWIYPLEERNPVSTQVCEPIAVKYIHDGDTLVTEDEETVRLAGIDTPEIETDAGKDAKAKLENLLSSGSVCMIVGTPQEGYYGRTLGWIYNNGSLVNHQLLKTGHAQIYEGS